MNEPVPQVQRHVQQRVDAWVARRTHTWSDWPLQELVAAKSALGATVSLVVPARNEAATVGVVVAKVREALMGTTALLDEIVVIDSDSDDATYDVATDAGAVVHRATEIRPDLGVARGKGEAMWKSLFVTTGDLVVFMDADLTEWDTHFVPGLLGPLLHDPGVALVKGFYQRPFREGEKPASFEGGRVTELVARPLLALEAPELTGLVQPLAGEWAVRRDVFAGLCVPSGYGVEIAALLDVHRTRGLDALAQVDLGRRAHTHQPLRDLAAMAAQIQAAVAVRSGRGPGLATGRLDQELVIRQPAAGSADARRVHVPVGERPPAAPLLGVQEPR